MPHSTFLDWFSRCPQGCVKVEIKRGFLGRPRARLKSGSKRMKRGRLRPLGKKGQEWKAKREELKPLFEAAGITRCEREREPLSPACTPDNNLGFAHTLKRPDIGTGSGNLGRAALLCNFCHDAAGRLKRDEETELIEGIISARRVPVAGMEPRQL